MPSRSSSMSHSLDFTTMESSPLPGCSILAMLLLCAPRMAMQMAWSAYWAAFSPTLETRLASWVVQLMQIIGPITGLLVYPTVAVFSDHCTSRYGRRRPFLLAGTFGTVTVWVLMMLTNFVPAQYRDGFTIFLYVCMCVSVNVTQVPVMLLIADFAGDRQVTAFSIAQAYNTLGALLVSGYISLFGPATDTFVTFLAMLILVLVSTVLPVCICFRETPYVPDQPHRDLKSGLLAVYHGIKYLPRLLAVYCVVFILIMFGFSCYNGNKAQFFGLVVNDGNATGADVCGDKCSPAQAAYNDGAKYALGFVDALASFVDLAYLLLLPRLVQWYGARRVFTFALLPQMLFVVLSWVHSKPLGASIVALASISFNTVNSMQIPVILHVIGYGELNGLGMFAGAFNSANCFGQLLTFAVSPILVTTDLTHALPILVGGIVTFLGFLVAFFKFDIRMFTL
ncbi:hypothetical protein SPRG_05003 [Saprolegnia parasitica CBS 223.65]|uniref:Major facilitator superfamily (MFS) profile domain-containing protein n=1 Tax=Saprolegnia parasitica (strain CBS 223.65) TaxID=695850 RepID=A0A067CM09_SAPPC|nr:hypothetical protein SPRG_05003 [Saprolegnia parasitica CBS 223.65]KDO30245.1 hypothetical protein SPRG_05003 [Saprolegnia parasitica CBS 223.65]|eukprot:XP_012198906.1 hypothetical protein SPRG_05003 [Saprolegnia parasitica CBS 223.65]